MKLISLEPLSITWLSVSCTNELPELILIASYDVLKFIPAALQVTNASAHDNKLAVAK